MSKRNKRIAGWIAFLFVCFHVSALFIFASPQNFGLNKGKKVVAPYVVPLFEQTWSMFAPCPLVTGKLKVKIEYQDKTIDWFYPVNNSRKWHSYLRASHHGDLVILEANLISWLLVDMNEFNLSLNDTIPAYLTEEFKHAHCYFLIRRYIYGLSKKMEDHEPVRAYVKAEMRNVKTNESGTLELPVYQW